MGRNARKRKGRRRRAHQQNGARVRAAGRAEEQKRIVKKCGAISSLIGAIVGSLVGVASVVVPFFIFDKEGAHLGVYGMSANESVAVVVDPLTGLPRITGHNAHVNVVVVNTGRTAATLISVDVEGDESVPMSMCGGARQITIEPSASAAIVFQSGTNAASVPASVRVRFVDGHSESIEVTKTDELAQNQILEVNRAAIDAAAQVCAKPGNQ